MNISSFVMIERWIKPAETNIGGGGGGGGDDDDYLTTYARVMFICVCVCLCVRECRFIVRGECKQKCDW